MEPVRERPAPATFGLPVNVPEPVPPERADVTAAPGAPRRLLGLALVAAAYLPAHRLLDPAATGVAGAATRDIGDALWGLTLWGTVLAVAAALALTVLAPPVPLRALLRGPGDRLLGSGALAVVAAAGVAFGLSLAAGVWVFDRLPTLVDAMVQLAHARAWAHGALAAPLADPAAARMLQNGVGTADGWVSVYPPGHTALLALGMRLGVPWLVGPLLTAVTAGATTLAARSALPDRPRTALLGGLLVALSPFVALLGGGYLSHTSAAAAGALACWAALRARDGRARWALAAGAAMGVMVTSRPWTGLVLGSTLTIGVWAAATVGRAQERASAGPRWLAARAALWALGGLPFAVALGLYNARWFGHPLRLGYDVAFGAAHGLGLHPGPWGDAYGAREALSYSGFDLMALGAHLFETPVSAIAVVGVWLATARALPRGAGLLLAWALLPVLGNALYWHHGYHLGPRMLYEAAPAWCVLTVLAVVELTRGGDRRARAALWLAVIAVPAGLLLQVPARIQASRWSGEARARATPPPLPPGPAIVFVHGSWPSRVAARLAGAGMRRDSIESALRRNDLCLVQGLAEAREAGVDVDDGPELDFEPRPGSPPELRAVAVAPGTFARVDPRLAPIPACVREASADREGTLELEPLAWQTPIPGLEEGGPLFFRDLGPEANARVLARHPGLPAWLALPTAGGALLPYEEAERRLWGGAGG